jgi:cell division protein ZapA (FtsZ GTPase activity inhibitor)
VAKESIKVSLSGRSFPVIVDEDEAAAIREAARMINEKIGFFRLEYGMREETDIALMCCLEIATDFLKHKRQAEIFDTTTLVQKLSILEKHLDISHYIEE